MKNNIYLDTICLKENLQKNNIYLEDNYSELNKKIKWSANDKKRGVKRIKYSYPT